MRAVVHSLAGAAVLLLGCQPVLEGFDDPFAEEEAAFRAQYDATPIALAGIVVAADGAPVVGAQVTLSAVSADAPAAATTDATGAYRFQGLVRRNRTVTVTATDFRDDIGVAILALPLDVSVVDQQAVVLTTADPNTTRFLFAGDVALGRRFLDPDSDTPRDQVPAPHPGAIIATDNPMPGTRTVFEHVAPLIAAVDYPVVNFESPVTDNPTTPHQTKDFAFFSLPGSLPALTEIGIEYVSLGNNHTYDYLDSGLRDTLDHLDAAGLRHSGAGMDADEAHAPFIASLGDTDYAMISATSIVGSQHPVSYVASDTKGGAASVFDGDRFEDSITDAVSAGQVPIPQIHTGDEYVLHSDDRSGEHFETALAAGAPLVIGHHPHVAQDIRVEGDAVVFYSLGNFAFDQSRQQTMLGQVAIVDMSGGQVVSAWAQPVYIEDFRPRLFGGWIAGRELLRVVRLSTRASTYAYGGRVWIDLGGPPAKVSTRQIETTVVVDESGTGVLDLRSLLGAEESLAQIEAPTINAAQAGIDLLVHGDVEDYDVDGELVEAARFDVSSGSTSVCMRSPYRGVAALCSVRRSSNATDSIIVYRNRVRVLGDADGTPNKVLSLFGFIRRQNAGDTTAVVRFMASGEANVFGEQHIVVPGGDSEWQSFFADIDMPADDPALDPRDDEGHARAIQLILRHAPPRKGIALAMYDDLAIISWEPGLIPLAQPIAGANNYSFVRIAGDPGTHSVTLTATSTRPAAVP